VFDFLGPPLRYPKTYARDAGWTTVGHQILTDEKAKVNMIMILN
jgi:hypothetical protein